MMPEECSIAAKTASPGRGGSRRASRIRGPKIRRWVTCTTRSKGERTIVWWADLLWRFWNGLTAWVILIVHVFGGWEQFPFYNEARSGNWYDFGFLLGAGSPLLGTLSGRSRR